jgi:tRNA(Arg) A34 adenosine deaminase TadA
MAAVLIFSLRSLSESKASSIGFGKRTRTGLSNRSNRNNAATAHQRTMAEQSAEAVPEPKAIHNWLLYLVGIAMCMSGMAYGYDTGTMFFTK